MTITNGYCTLAEIKHANRLNIESSDSDADEMLEAVIEGVSRLIDDECGRRFYPDSDEISKYYTAGSFDKLFTDDMCSPSSDIVVEIDDDGDGVYETTFSSSDFNLLPYNAEQDGEPYQKIEITDNGEYQFPKYAKKAVKVTSKFGWSNTPKPIKQACLIQSGRIFKRGATSLGSQSMTALGKMTLVIPSMDPDVQQLISRYKKIRFG